MEKLTFSPNGQWELSKAIPKCTDVYNNLSIPENNYTGIDKENIQNHVVKEAAKLNRVKHITNPETGEPEPHVLVHYGMFGYGEKNKVAPWKDDNPNFNNYKILDNGDIHIAGKNGGVVSHSARYSSKFAKPEAQDPSEPDEAEYMSSIDPKDSKLMSFWVPKSKIAMSQNEDGGGTMFNRIDSGKYTPATWDEVEKGNRHQTDGRYNGYIEEARAYHNMTHKK